MGVLRVLPCERACLDLRQLMDWSCDDDDGDDAPWGGASAICIINKYVISNISISGISSLFFFFSNSSTGQAKGIDTNQSTKICRRLNLLLVRSEKQRGHRLDACARCRSSRHTSFLQRTISLKLMRKVIREMNNLMH